ncbi:MAG: hypothetical protein J0H27_08880 [Xanthomonadales bacterium]|nr:hypothetical protein [Xanthomonadales bacterium]ODU93061.1 MAG: hypothetical protein ABT18_09870 [Rhodanobacter sp. SCN 66-43]OJY83770.1 MAG: hypothetical protein BGP23_14140 [Xanthomonadales bacterium 66-474]
MLKEFHLTRAEARCLSQHDRAELVRWMMRRQWPHLRLGYSPRKRSVLSVVAGIDGGRGARQ